MISNLVNSVKEKETAIAVIGMGYVGLPLAVEFGKHFKVVGFDISEPKISLLKTGEDPSKELTPEELAQTKIEYTTDASSLAGCKFIVIAVPTPIDKGKNPDLTPLIKASELIGKHIKPGTIAVFESTVYPGVTEEICGPIIEKESGLTCGKDFFLGYSPERINPGDKEHTVDKILKIVSGQNEEVLQIVAEIYSSVVTAGVHLAASIKVAEAAKVIENAQRDINIAFINELAIIFDQMGIDTKSVLEAAGTKWNFLNFKPGLVGGHCIGVDPYYLTFKAQELGHTAQTILSGRRINDGMGKWIARTLVKSLINSEKKVKNSKVVIFGLTFKENVSDVRNSKVKDIIQELQDFGVDVFAHDPNVDPTEAQKEFGVKMIGLGDIKEMDAFVFAVAHDVFKEITPQNVVNMSSELPVPFFDLKWQFDQKAVKAAGFNYWRL